MLPMIDLALSKDKAIMPSCGHAYAGWPEPEEEGLVSSRLRERGAHNERKRILRHATTPDLIASKYATSCAASSTSCWPTATPAALMKALLRALLDMYWTCTSACAGRDPGGVRPVRLPASTRARLRLPDDDEVHENYNAGARHARGAQDVGRRRACRTVDREGKVPRRRTAP